MREREIQVKLEQEELIKTDTCNIDLEGRLRTW